MKRFTIVTALFGISLLMVWMVFQASTASSKPEDSKIEDPVPAGNEVMVPVTRPESRQVAPVYDATGELISDPTGTVSNANDAGNMKIAPVFDASGRLMSDPTGTIWSSDNS